MEQWKIIKGFEYYEVSSEGRIRNIKTKRILKDFICPKGYHKVTLYSGTVKSRKTKQVHRLVAQEFIHNKENKTQINHKDCNKNNNFVSNLEWCTNSENQLHTFKNNLQISRRGELNGNSKLSEQDILCIRNSNNFTEALAEQYSVSCTTISNIIYGETWKCVGGRIRAKSKRNKLDEEQVTFIRSNKDKYSSSDLMKMFNVSRSTINFIKNNKRWKIELEVLR